jgi:hypothetical protein
LKIKPSTVVWIFIWCLFMQITVGSIFVIALLFAVPSTNFVVKPLVCPGGQMQQVAQDQTDPTYNGSPGASGTNTTLKWYCVDEKTGIKTEISVLSALLSADAICGLLFFLVVIDIIVILGRNKRFSAWWASHSGRAVHFR